MEAFVPRLGRRRHRIVGVVSLSVADRRILVESNRDRVACCSTISLTVVTTECSTVAESRLS